MTPSRSLPFGSHHAPPTTTQPLPSLQALIDAMEAQNVVIGYLVALLVFFAWRTLCLPSILRYFFGDLPGPLDEIALLLLTVHFLGFTKVKLSVALFYKKWIQPYVERAMVSTGLKPEAKTKQS